MNQNEYIKESGRLRQTTEDSFMGCLRPGETEEYLLFYVNHKEVTQTIPFTRYIDKKVTIHDVTREGISKFEDALYRKALQLKTTSSLFDKALIADMTEISALFHSIESGDAAETDDPLGFAQGKDITFAFHKEYSYEGKKSIPSMTLLVDYFEKLADNEDEVMVRFK